MSDSIFHEVDEEVRREKLKQLWAKYGSYLIVLAVLFVFSVAGWRGYEWYETKKSQEAGAAFEAANTLSEQGKHDEALVSFQKLAAEANAGYRVLASLREAEELSRRDPKAALGMFDGIAGNFSIGKELRDLAAIRAGFLALDFESPEQLRQRLEPLADSGATFRHSARELLALTAWRSNDFIALKRWSDAVAGDAETPGTVRSRVEMLMALVSAEGKS